MPGFIQMISSFNLYTKATKCRKLTYSTKGCINFESCDTQNAEPAFVRPTAAALKRRWTTGKQSTGYLGDASPRFSLHGRFRGDKERAENL